MRDFVCDQVCVCDRDKDVDKKDGTCERGGRSGGGGEEKNYFTSSDPHHDIQFIPSDNLSGISIWHSIWHVF